MNGKINQVIRLLKLNQPIRFQRLFYITPENIKKSYGFLMFSGGRERMH